MSERTMTPAEHAAALARAQAVLDDANARYEAARKEKKACALQLNAAQEELRRAGLLSFRRNQMKAELAQRTAAFTEANRAVSALQAEVDAADMALEALRSIVPVQEAPATPAAPAVEATPARAEAPVKSPAPTRPRTKAADPEVRLDRLMQRLELFYPEHQVFALDSISSDLRTRLSVAARQSGYADVASLLESRGWRCIRGEAVLALRRGKYCTPGDEPAVIRPQVESMLSRLAACYPDRVIPRSIQRDHKSLSQDITGLYQWLGYGSAAAMLEAYGYRCLSDPRGGRPATDAAAFLSDLRAAYPDAPPASVQQIALDHPELAATLKTMQNRAPALFGMTLRQYLMAQGLLGK